MVKRIEEALEDIRQGKMIILVDDEDRENEGDLAMAAEKVTPEAINFMAKYGRGLICLSLTEERLSELRLPMMVSENTSRFQTAFTISVDARCGVTTGISAADRAQTILTAIDDGVKPEDLVSPGHIWTTRFPTTTSPVAMPIRTARRQPGTNSRRVASATVSSAARAARGASSSCPTG